MTRRKLEQAANAGDHDAQLALAKLILNDTNLDHRADQVHELLTKSASNGNVEAQFLLAGELCQTVGGQLLYEKNSYRWLKNAADQEFAPALEELATCYESGNYVQQDFREAAQLFLRAAKIGSHGAIIQFTALCDEHNIVELDGIAMAKLQESAAAAGCVDAALLLANRYINGDGVVKSWPVAVKWLRVAAKKRDATANALLAVIFGEGRGDVPIDREKAAYYREEAKILNELRRVDLLKEM